MFRMELISFLCGPTSGTHTHTQPVTFDMRLRKSLRMMGNFDALKPIKCVSNGTWFPKDIPSLTLNMVYTENVGHNNTLYMTIALLSFPCPSLPHSLSHSLSLSVSPYLSMCVSFSFSLYVTHTHTTYKMTAILKERYWTVISIRIERLLFIATIWEIYSKNQ